MSTTPTADAAQERRAGLIYGLSAYLLWGVLPLYFKALAHVSPGEILAHRIIWSLIFLAVLVALWRRWTSVKAALASRRVFLTLVASAVLIAVNWLVYIMAVVSGHVLEGSLGYYLNPLVNILLGVALLGERLSKAQIFATGLAAAGVAVLAVGAASGLWISLTLAASFALYGYLRKIVAVDALEGLSIETAMLAPIALGWILFIDSTGQGGFDSWSWGTIVLLVAGGAITAIPLLLFTAAARRLPLSTIGFLQYIAPSLQFLFAVLLFGEALTTAHLVCFGAIWTALAIVTFDGWRRAVRSRRVPVESLA
ncbi:EamA family transporter RarD [Sphingosinicella sp. YJ22]|uniref:EamA family transporter RarD n=1 Tax=Sphingosinicella sp. YJ22 TaxID=1104780 RepID=UPI001409C89E|nr:EamA family transporter RarD [Sphingosinicella sp. YJ22]